MSTKDQSNHPELLLYIELGKIHSMNEPNEMYFLIYWEPSRKTIPFWCMPEHLYKPSIHGKCYAKLQNGKRVDEAV